MERDDGGIVDDQRCREVGDDVGPDLRSFDDKVAGKEDQDEIDGDHSGDLSLLDGTAFETGND